MIIVVHECDYRYLVDREYSLWSLAFQDGMETY
jgi:hypothetical protein